MSWIRNRLRGSTLRFVLYTLGCLVLLAGLIVRIGNISLFAHRVTYRALLSDVTGLDSGAYVKVAGVTVGQVTGITTRHGQALVSFAVDQDLHLPTATQVGLRWQNVLGQMYLSLFPPGTRGPYLAPGATIPSSQEVGDAQIGQFLNALGPVLQSIDPAEANAFVQGVLGGLQGNLDQVSALIDNAAVVSKTVGGLDVQVGSVIDNLSSVIGALGARSQDLQSVISNLATISTALASRNQTLDQVVTNFSDLSGKFSQLLSQNRGNLDTLIGGLNTVAQTIQSHRQDLSTGLSTLSAGLEPYTMISSYGQWFNVQVVYLCLANQAKCQYQEGGPQPSQVSPSASTSSSGAAPPEAAARVGLAPSPSAAQLEGPGAAGSAGSSLLGIFERLAGVPG